jgi:hypothetical protein
MFYYLGSSPRFVARNVITSLKALGHYVSLLLSVVVTLTLVKNALEKHKPMSMPMSDLRDTQVHRCKPVDISPETVIS